MIVATAEGVITAIGVLVVAITGLVTALTAARTKRAVAVVEAKVDRVHGEVATENGLSLGALADRDEGRRIEADVPEAERTHAEAAYVAAKDEPHVPKP